MYTLEETIKKLNDLFNDHVDGADAKSFLHHYNIYNHAIDDIIDEKISDVETILSSYNLALDIYSSNFYRKYQQELHPIIKLIHHTWIDSVHMEQSKELWQKEQADTLKNVGIEMLLTVIEILGGYKCRRECSIAIRKNSFDKQHNIYEIV